MSDLIEEKNSNTELPDLEKITEKILKLFSLSQSSFSCYLTVEIIAYLPDYSVVYHDLLLCYHLIPDLKLSLSKNYLSTF